MALAKSGQVHAKKRQGTRVVVIGLGRFGSALAYELCRHGSEVLGIDSNPTLVQEHSNALTHAAVADTTDRQSLEQLGVPDFPHAVVGIGHNIESSILTTSVLSDFDIPQIWAKAVTRQHGRILERVGAHHVILPEYDMGERVAHLVAGRMLDYIEFDEDYAMVKTVAPSAAVGKTLTESGLRQVFGVTVVAIKSPGEDFRYATPASVVQRDDLLIVAGSVEQVETFADMT